MNITVGLLRWLADTLFTEGERLNSEGEGEAYKAATCFDAADALADLADEISRG